MSGIAGNRERGLSLVEALVGMLLIGMGAAVALPALATTLRAVALQRTAGHLAGLLAQARAGALLEGRTKALVFERHDQAWHCFLAEDGDGDGVLREDLERGVDPVLGEVFVLEDHRAGLGILPDPHIPDPSGRGWLSGDRADPVRAGRGDIVTFTRDGTATPCSLYLTDHRDRMRVLRVLGSCGRFRVLEWRRGWPTWRRVRW